MLRPCSISSDRCRINSAFLACSQLGVGYLAGVLAGQTNSTWLMPPLSERGETKVVEPFMGIDTVVEKGGKVLEAPQKSAGSITDKNTSSLKKGAWFWQNSAQFNWGKTWYLLKTSWDGHSGQTIHKASLPLSTDVALMDCVTAPSCLSLPVCNGAALFRWELDWQ